MNRTKITTAAAEARRFLKAVKAYEANPPIYEFTGNKETGALRRASMDLTRALADMRRPL
jgi:hypothetical protein